MQSHSLGDKLKILRKQNGYSVKDVSKMLHDVNLPTNEKTIYKWEKNISTPDIKTFNALAMLYNVTVSTFFEENSSLHSLNIAEYEFISSLRTNDDFKKIIYILTKNEKEEMKNGDSIMH